MRLMAFCRGRKMYYSFAQSNLCAHNIMRNGTGEQKRKYLPGLANFQLIQAKLADMYTDLEAARHMAHRALWLAQQGKRVSKEAAAALLFVARASMRAADH